MKHSPADILRYAIIALGHGYRPSDMNESEWKVYADMEVDKPDNLIVVYNTAGKIKGRMQPTGESVEHNGFQILVRTTDSQSGRKKLAEIERDLLQDIRRTTVTIGTDAYMIKAVHKTSGILPLGKDQANKERFLFSFNGTIVIS